MGGVDTLRRDSAAYRDPLAGPPLDPRLEPPVPPDGGEKPVDPPVTPPECVVRGETAAGRDLRLQVAKIFEEPLLVGVAEDEIEGTAEGGYQVVGVAETGIDVRGHAGPGEVGQCPAVPLGIDLDGGHPPAGLRRRPGQPDRRVSRRCSDLEDLLEIALDDKVVKDLPVLVGDVQIRIAASHSSAGKSCFFLELIIYPTIYMLWQGELQVKEAPVIKTQNNRQGINVLFIKALPETDRAVSRQGSLNQ